MAVYALKGLWMTLRSPALTSLLLATFVGCDCADGGDDNVIDVSDPPTPAPQYNRGFYLDMARGPDGRLWLAHQDREATALTVAVSSGDPPVFTHTRVDGEARMENGLPVGDFDGGNYATITVDANNVPTACHWDRTGNSLRCGSTDGTAWNFVVVQAGDVGQFASLGFHQGAPIVAYYDYGDLQLVVAWKTATGWQHEVVDEGTLDADGTAAGATEPDVGKYASLFVDGDTVRIAYYDAANGDLKVASGGPGSWDVEVWAGSGTGNLGTWPRLSSHGGVTYVTYSDEDKKDLIWGSWNGAVLTTEIVDGGDFVGPDSAIGWVGDDPIVMYHDGVNNDAKLAVRGASGWTLSTQRSDGAVGFHNQVEVDASGQINWVCFDHTATDVVFQRFTLP